MFSYILYNWHMLLVLSYLARELSVRLVYTYMYIYIAYATCTIVPRARTQRADKYTSTSSLRPHTLLVLSNATSTIECC